VATDLVLFLLLVLCRLVEAANPTDRPDREHGRITGWIRHYDGLFGVTVENAKKLYRETTPP